MCYRPTNRPTDTAYYRDARTHLKSLEGEQGRKKKKNKRKLGKNRKSHRINLVVTLSLRCLVILVVTLRCQVVSNLATDSMEQWPTFFTTRNLSVSTTSPRISAILWTILGSNGSETQVYLVDAMIIDTRY